VVANLSLGVLQVPQNVRACLLGIVVFAAFALTFIVAVTWGRDLNLPPLVAAALWVWMPLAAFISGLACGYLANRERTRTLLALGTSAVLFLACLALAFSVLGLRVFGFGNEEGLPWLLVIGLSAALILPLVIAGGTVGAILRYGWHA
jgi:hypothetical protein